jgi:hypothetical protein
VPAGVAIALQGVRLTPAAIERKHVLRPEPLAQRVLGDQPFELRDDVRMPSARELGVDPLLERREPGLVEARRLVRERDVVGELSQRRPAPQPEGLAQQLRRPLHVAALARDARLLRERLEHVGVQLAGGHLEHVAAVARGERVAEALPERRDDVVQCSAVDGGLSPHRASIRRSRPTT